jgi:4,5-DOPA dioxygenase extradiol
MQKLMPVVFVGHGSPMNAVADNDFTLVLNSFAKSISKPKAILCISAHWMTKGSFVTGAEDPKQIYDFYGFPKELYEVKYKPKGSLELAKQTAILLKSFNAELDTEWGIDHGTWSVLKHMYPKCDIPVIQLSLDGSKTEKENYEIAKKLFDLRKQGVLIMGSGNIVHNLSMIDWDISAKNTPDWARGFDKYIKNALDSVNDDLLINYAENADSEYAVPTNEHYLPMLYIAALRGKGEKVNYFFEGFQNDSLSMRCFAIGI